MSIQRVSFYVLLVVVTVAFVWLLTPYYTAILWAVILAILFFPVHRRLERLMGGRSTIAALLTLLLCICLVILPALGILASLIQEGSSLYQRISSNEIDLNAYLLRLQSILPAFLDNWLTSLKLAGFAEVWTKVSSSFMEAGQSIAAVCAELWTEHAAVLHQHGIDALSAFLPVSGWHVIGEDLASLHPPQ